ncbi:MAG: N-terminal phage integrase SAM-like domain-containing protein [Jatrophihabitans sp.]
MGGNPCPNEQGCTAPPDRTFGAECSSSRGAFAVLRLGVTKRDAERAAVKREERAAAGTLADASRGRLTFAAYVEKFYRPAAQHLEPTTLAAYRSNLDSHFLPHFGRVRMIKVVASTVQAWVNEVSAEVEDFDGSRKPQLSPRSVRKYHMFCMRSSSGRSSIRSSPSTRARTRRCRSSSSSRRRRSRRNSSRPCSPRSRSATASSCCRDRDRRPLG